MKQKRSLLILLVAALAVGGATAAHAAKIEICHLPPGNPGNVHTITINANALPAHQAHGDLVGSCVTNCGTICDDGNKCTIDVVPSDTECQCQAAMRPPVDCNDGRACTTDSCDPAQGCLSAQVVCEAPDLCTASVCSEPAGTCEETPVVCPAGQGCNPDSGACEAALPPCGDCLVSRLAAGCEVPACEALVCAEISPCCDFAWNEFIGCPTLASHRCVGVVCSQ